MAFTPVVTWGGEHAPFQLLGKKSLLHVRGHDRTHDELHEYAGGHLGFYGYLRVANASITRRCRIGLLDLPDRLCATPTTTSCTPPRLPRRHSRKPRKTWASNCPDARTGIPRQHHRSTTP